MHFPTIPFDGCSSSRWFERSKGVFDTESKQRLLANIEEITRMPLILFPTENPEIGFVAVLPNAARTRGGEHLHKRTFA